MNIPTSMKNAKLQGERYYFTGKPCKRGHVENRYSSDGSCIKCSIDRAETRYAKNRDKILSNCKDQYNKDPKKKRDKANAHRELHPLKVKIGKKREYEKNKHKYIERVGKWAKNNPDKRKVIMGKWYKTHPVEAYLRVVERRAEKLKRTPAWLSESDKQEIGLIYKIANRVSRETGMQYHVDHKIPLRGDLVCGLHVPTNLQLLTAGENLSKGNRFVV